MKKIIMLYGLIAGYFMMAQSPAIEWQKSLGGSGGDVSQSIQQTADGGYIVAGYSGSNNGDVTGNHGGFDYWIVKIDAAGDIEWQKSLGGSGSDTPYSIQQTADGGYIVAGGSGSNNGDVTGNHGGWDYWIVKIDAAGDIEWQKSLGGSSWDSAQNIQITADGGYIVAGDSDSNNGDVTGNHGSFDYWIVKLDMTGGIEWQKSLGGSGNDSAKSIQQTTDGGYIVAGGSTSNDGDVTGNHGYYGYWIVKLTEAGDMEWQKSLGGTGLDFAQSIQQTADGGYIVAGYSDSNNGDVIGNHGSYDYWIVKLNTAGDLEWQKSLGGSGEDIPYSAQQTTDGGYIVVGHSWSNNGDVTGNHGGVDYWIVKLGATLDAEEFSSRIAVYPNPVTTVLNISANEPVKSVTLFNLLGQEVMATAHFEKTLRLDISGLPVGLYLVEIATETANETFKVVKR